jgi:hypothetical protein
VGTGSTTNPIVISAEAADCSVVRACLSAGPGVAYDPATGVIGADVSDTPGNTLTLDSGGLFVAPGAAVVATGCGLAGDGSAADPISVAGGTWPYACDVAAEGGGVFCAPDGSLRGEPLPRMDFFGQVFNQSFSPAVAVPVAATTITTFSVEVTNPDPCREAFVVIARQGDVDITLPPGAGAMTGIEGDQMTYDVNTGSTTASLIHHQFVKMGAGSIGPGATTTYTVNVMAGRGIGGAVYERVQADIHVWIISNPGA